MKTNKASDRVFHRRRITVTVLSEEPLPEHLDLDKVAHEIVHGDCSGEVKWYPNEEIGGRAMAKALRKQGSDPEFFRINDKGEDLE